MKRIYAKNTGERMEGKDTCTIWESHCDWTAVPITSVAIGESAFTCRCNGCANSISFRIVIFKWKILQPIHSIYENILFYYAQLFFLASFLSKFFGIIVIIIINIIINIIIININININIANININILLIYTYFQDSIR